MRLDFHTHGKLAKKLPFSTVYTDWLFDEARRAGQDALCTLPGVGEQRARAIIEYREQYGRFAAVEEAAAVDAWMSALDWKSSRVTACGQRNKTVRPETLYLARKL